MRSVSRPVIGCSKCPSLWLTSVLTYAVFFSPSFLPLLAYVCLYYFLAWVVGGCFSRRLPSLRCFCSPSSIDRSHVRVQSTASGQPRPACKTQGLRAPLRSPGCCVCAVCFAFSMLSYVRTRVCERSARGVCVCVWLMIRSLVEKPTSGFIKRQPDIEIYPVLFTLTVFT